ncbi:M56 family metallopeptidase [Pedobacter agri]|uniref:M56 family metallopeptidase n=1 Tax=Pedobacter agri TaxID=454586 RepID=UPI00292E6235|nr:M56 family metallopeptidase [Pedobacter agri]
MPQFFLILLKINLVLILFSATYYLVLRKLTFYSLNRFFLIFGIAFSSAYPFINLNSFFVDKPSVPAFIPQFNQNVKQFVQQDSVSIFWQALTLVFYLGVLLMAIRLMIQFISLHQMHKKSSVSKIRDFNVRILSEEVSPFSFWQTIYINPALHKTQDLNNILEHEKVHVEEWHTLDIILAEICVVFYWFNPGVWLMKKAVRENIEFITDAKILKKGIDKKAYQYSLLDVGSLQPSIAIVNNFNLSDLKKRIIMMNAKRSSQVNLSRYLLVLPVLICVTLAFTIDSKNAPKAIVPLTNTDKITLANSELKSAIIKPAKAGQKVKVKSAQEPAQKIDSVKKVSFVFNTSFETVDTTHQSISNELGKLVGKVIDFKTEESTDRNAFVQHFTFKDSLKAGPATMGVFLGETGSQQPIKSIKGTINNVVLIKVRSKSLNDPNSAEAVTASSNKIDYYIDGEKASNAEFKSLDVNKILDIRIVKGNNGAIHIRTKP